MQIKNLWLFSILILLVPSKAFGQYQMNLVPRLSPDRSVSQTIGFAEISIEYGSPAAKNREIWGDLVPYETVWRAGANNATIFSTTEDVWLDGQYLPKGKYGLFVIPKEVGDWTLIFSKDSDQWGAFRYDSIDDQLSIETAPQVRSHAENLFYEVSSLSPEKGLISLSWGSTSLQVAIKTKVVDLLALKVKERVQSAPENTRWIVFLQGAEFLVDHTDDYQLAREWIDRSEDLAQLVEEWDDRFYPKIYIEGHLAWVKAKILARSGDFPSAIAAAKLVMGMKGSYNYYDRNNDDQEIDQHLEKWTASQKP